MFRRAPSWAPQPCVRQGKSRAAARGTHHRHRVPREIVKQPGGVDRSRSCAARTLREKRRQHCEPARGSGPALRRQRVLAIHGALREARGADARSQLRCKHGASAPAHQARYDSGTYEHGKHQRTVAQATFARAALTRVDGAIMVAGRSVPRHRLRAAAAGASKRAAFARRNVCNDICNCSFVSGSHDVLAATRSMRVVLAAPAAPDRASCPRRRRTRTSPRPAPAARRPRQPRTPPA